MLPTLVLAFTLHVTPAVADLAGEWRYTSTRGTTYWDTSSNAYLGHGGGMSDTFVFAKDGTYKEYAYIENSPSAGWTTKIFTTMEGRYEVVGDSLKLTVLKGRYKTEDNRVARYNIDRPMTEEEAKKRQRAYRFTLTRGDKPAMVFDLGGEKMTYARVR